MLSTTKKNNKSRASGKNPETLDFVFYYQNRYLLFWVNKNSVSELLFVLV